MISEYWKPALAHSIIASAMFLMGWVSFLLSVKYGRTFDPNYFLLVNGIIIMICSVIFFYMVYVTTQNEYEQELILEDDFNE